MATKKKTAGKPKTPVVPVVVLNLHNLAIDLRNTITVSDLPESVRNGRDKIATSIDKYADRVGKAIANVGKADERKAAKTKRVEAKKEKATKRIADLKAKLAEAEKALTS